MSVTPPPFEVRERVDPDGTLRMSVHGELDLATVPTLEQHLRSVWPGRRTMRLDLSEVSFLDSTGLRAVLSGVRDARERQLAVEVDPAVSAAVDEVLRMTGTHPLLWPRSPADPVG